MTIPFEELINIGWTKWEGGECPVPKGTLVRVRYRSGRELTALALDHSTHDWDNDNDEDDIIAYQVLELGPTAEGDPIIAGGVYEMRDGRLFRVIGQRIDIDQSRYVIVGEVMGSGLSAHLAQIAIDYLCENDFDLMRLCLPNRTYPVTIDGKEMQVSKEKLDKIKEVVGEWYESNL